MVLIGKVRYLNHRWIYWCLGASKHYRTGWGGCQRHLLVISDNQDCSARWKIIAMIGMLLH